MTTSVAARISDDELLTVGEVARILRVAESTVRKWIGRDEVPYLMLPGGDYRIPRVELFRALGGNVDSAPVMLRLIERLRSEPDDVIDEEIASVRAGRSTQR